MQAGVSTRLFEAPKGTEMIGWPHARYQVLVLLCHRALIRHLKSHKVNVAQSCPTLCDPLEFSRPEYWSGGSFPSPGDLPNRGIEPRSLTLQVDSLQAEPQEELRVI